MESDIFIYDNEMAQFDIVSAKRYLKHPVYHSGNDSCLSVKNKSLFWNVFIDMHLVSCGNFKKLYFECNNSCWKHHNRPNCLLFWLNS